MCTYQRDGWGSGEKDLTSQEMELVVLNSGDKKIVSYRTCVPTSLENSEMISDSLF